jgi:eukaryotic-like serine/threonine-protein kinase
MPLEAGARLGPYEIVAPIGAGGMGEVYRARDTRLDRTVAIKVLPESLTADPQLRERFDREARAISSLNHPHICTLHDVGHQEGVDFLVLEHLEGETLAQRIARSPVPTAEALAIAVDIGDALATAHRAGVIHRDLKPANVMLTKAGAKLLDFGLAKNAAPAIATSGLSMAPTTPPNLTAQGTILGTFQYMAPEQIEGVDADARTDIFAFGAVLFEMLTGRPAFDGKTRAQLLGAILKDEPPAVSSLVLSLSKDERGARRSTSSPRADRLDRIVSTCLAKDPDDRWQTARDLLRELKWVAADGAADRRGLAEAGSDSRSRRDSTGRPALAGPALWAIVGALVIALAASGALALRHLRETPPVAEPLQFTIPAPENSQFGGPPGGGSGVATQLAVSPDGRHVMFVARKDGTYGLWLRPIASLSARQLPGTEDASFPFWSPDSRYVAFFAGGKLKKAQISGGPPVILCDAAQGRGGTWNRDNIIVFGLLGSSLQRVSSAGGTPVAAAQLDTAYGETSHRWPHFLPDGQHFLFTTVTGALGAALKPSVIRIGALGSLDATTLLQVESSVAYASGHLLFVRNGSLLAQQFDVTARHLTGDSYPVAEQVLSEGSRYASFSTSPTGVLAYAHGSRLSAGSRLVWFDRTGRTTGQLGELAPYLNLALSPDERRVAVTMATGSPPNGDIWTIDVARGVSSRLTFDPALESLPIWSPDSSRVVFQSLRIPDAGLRQKLASGTSADGLVLKAEGGTLGVPVPADWSRDGRFIAYDFQTGTSAGSDLWILPLSSGDKRPYPFVQGPGPDTNAAFSHDGHWIAYQAFDSGAPQVYVQPFPPTGGRFQVSKESGLQPQWRGDGKELFFLANDGSMWAAPIDTAREFQAGLAQRLFETGAAAPGRRQYAVTKDGQRFLVLVTRSSERNASPEPLTVVVNWLAGVQK